MTNKKHTQITNPLWEQLWDILERQLGKELEVGFDYRVWALLGDRLRSPLDNQLAYRLGCELNGE